MNLDPEVTNLLDKDLHLMFNKHIICLFKRQVFHTEDFLH